MKQSAFFQNRLQRGRTPTKPMPVRIGPYGKWALTAGKGGGPVIDPNLPLVIIPSQVFIYGTTGSIDLNQYNQGAAADDWSTDGTEPAWMQLQSDGLLNYANPPWTPIQQQFMVTAANAAGSYPAWFRFTAPYFPPFWGGDPEFSFNFLDLPASVNLDPYVFASPRPTSYTTDTGTITDAGVLTIPDLGLGTHAINVTATNAYGTAAAVVTVNSVADAKPEATLYVNPDYAGGGASGPDDGANPPTSHQVVFNTGLSRPEIRRDQTYTWITGPNGDTATRTVLRYMLNSNNVLTPGDSYRYSVMCERLPDETGTTLAITSNGAEITVEAMDRDISSGEIKRLFIEFAPNNATPAVSLNAGTGVTTNRTEQYRFWAPQLHHLGYRVLTNPRISALTPGGFTLTVNSKLAGEALYVAIRTGAPWQNGELIRNAVVGVGGVAFKVCVTSVLGDNVIVVTGLASGLAYQVGVVQETD